MNNKILIVEDDVEGLKLIGLMLQRQGYEVIAATAGDQALVKAKAETPDLVILDVMMPGVDGYQVCRQLRSNPTTAQLPVLMFTAKALLEDKTAGFEAGADDYLTKPIHPSELVSRVEVLLKRSKLARAAAKRRFPARVIGVMGAKGGVGTSTTVVNLAVAASQIRDCVQDGIVERRVSIVDLRVGLGTVALLLGQMPRGGWATLLDHSLDRLDLETVESQAMTYPGGLRYLPAALQPDGGQYCLPPDYVDVVLSRMAEAADLLFLDLGSVLDEATLHAVAFCDTVIVVVEPERVCLAMAQVLLEMLGALDPAPDDVRILAVERFRASPVYSQEKMETLLGQDLVGVIRPAFEDVRQAAEQGAPLVLLYPESEIAAQFRAFSQVLLT